MDQASENLYYVLVEKTEGEAALRGLSDTLGDGIAAYQKVYLWFTGTTGLALQEKMMCLMRPVQSKNEHEIADALEKWAEQERTLNMHGPDYELGAACKVTALRTIMHCRPEQFENMEREAKASHGGTMSQAIFETLYQKVREYAQQRRL